MSDAFQSLLMLGLSQLSSVTCLKTRAHILQSAAAHLTDPVLAETCEATAAAILLAERSQLELLELLNS
jgi:hypothetical protein